MVKSQKLTIENRLPPIIIKYENQLERDPNSLVFAALAEAYRKIGNYEGAFQVLREGIKNHPLYKFAYFTLAHCYFDVNQYQLAYTTLRPFVATERENFRVQNLFAETCLKLGQTEEALESLKYCLFLAPKNQEMAKKISEIEQSISPTVESFNEIAPKANVHTSAQFEVKNLTTVNAKEIDIDDWKQVDLSRTSSPYQKQGEQDGQDWQMGLMDNLGTPTQSMTVESHNEAPRTQSERSNDNDAPIITHTLVDLYCAQGLHQKGIEILQKILELNPNDHKSRARLLELRQAIAAPTDEASGPGVKLRLESFLQALKVRARQITSSQENPKRN